MLKWKQYHGVLKIAQRSTKTGTGQLRGSQGITHTQYIYQTRNGLLKKYYKLILMKDYDFYNSLLLEI